MKVLEEIETSADQQEVLVSMSKKYKVPAAYIGLEVVDAGKSGFLGLGKKEAKYSVFFKEEEFFTKHPRFVLSELLDFIGINDYHIEVSFDEANKSVTLQITSPEYSNLLIGKGASHLDAMQYLMEKLTYNDLIKFDHTIIVDVESYRERKIKPLVEVAIRNATMAKRKGRTISMSNLVSIIRKEIHRALQDMEGIETRSKGEGNQKTLLIIPAGSTGEERPERGDRGYGDRGDRGHGGYHGGGNRSYDRQGGGNRYGGSGERGDRNDRGERSGNDNRGERHGGGNRYGNDRNDNRGAGGERTGGQGDWRGERRERSGNTRYGQGGYNNGNRQERQGGYNSNRNHQEHDRNNDNPGNNNESQSHNDSNGHDSDKE